MIWFEMFTKKLRTEQLADFIQMLEFVLEEQRISILDMLEIAQEVQAQRTAEQQAESN